jgi:hypothetical protein
MSMSMELTKEVTDKDVLQEEYDQLRLEQDEATQRTERVKQVVQGVYNIIPEIPREEDAPLEEHVTKISESIQGFHTNITDLEVRQIPSTPPEEREKREKKMTTTIENIKSMEAECAKLYEESMGVWTQLTEDMELQEIGRSYKLAGQGQKFKEVMSTLPPTEMMETMEENRKLYSEMNQMRVQQQAHAQKIETLQEEAYKVTTEVAVVQGMVKQEVQESAEKLKTHITAEMDRGNCATGNTSKRKYHNCKGDISEVHGDLEESLKWLGMSHR